MVVKAVSPKFLSREETKRYVSQGYKLVKHSEVNPSLVSRGGERWRGQNRRQQAAGREQFMASSHWLCHKHVLTAHGAPWAKLATAAGLCGTSCWGDTTVWCRWQLWHTVLLHSGESSGAGWGLYPQDLLQGLTWGGSCAEDSGLEH